MTTVLVTGVGAIIGYGILRALRETDSGIRLIGSDIYPDAVGQAWADHFVVAPYTADSHYPEWLEKTLVENNVDLVIPGIEQDLYFFSDNRGIFEKLSVAVVLNNQTLINLTRDKWLMHEELASIDSSTRIDSYLQGDFTFLSNTLGLPFIVKPRKSYASKGLVRIKNEADFNNLPIKMGNGMIAQPMIGTDDEEYTVGIFGDGQGNISAGITLQRRLAADGSTAKAWVREIPELNAVVASLCAHFKPIGPTNLQFRKHTEGWKLLEINPRISSSTSLRTAFGYNESQMCINFYLHHQKIVQSSIRPGFAARYIADMVVYDRDHF
jgi:carbamoyl-phosphate synthase large subunit